ncbi:nucleotide-diphospho-sugar transferase [Aspergillus undulatus]|uniref:nucleotide-diphospho-sugar transferase n=1 Tax=Aspergillus undulatus TaxID=1810928 RepID=UPI003CCDBDA5
MPSKTSRHVPRWDAVPLPGSPYLIEKEVKRPSPLPLDSPIAALFLLLRRLLSGAYLVQRYRLLATLSSPSPVRAAWLMFLIDICARFGPVLFQVDMALYLLIRVSKSWQQPRYRLVGSESPTVDVFVICCGESLDLILDTVYAAASQDYPFDRYRVFVLDDARNPDLKDAIRTYNVQRTRSARDVQYLSRTKVSGKPRSFKAGNLRFGLEESRKTGVCSEYIAALDVDAIPEPDWLRRMVPHLLLDGKLAAVVPGLVSRLTFLPLAKFYADGAALLTRYTIQRHYNLPEDDVLGQDIATPWDISIEHMRDTMGVTNLYGSGYVMRRSALDSISGWPQVPSAEDLYCGHLLAGQGWKIAFCWDICQHDLTPDSLDALVSQRLRWVIQTEGDLIMARRFNFFLPPLDPGRQRTLARRATAMIGSLRLYKGLLDTLFPLLMTPILIFTLRPTDLIKPTN